jgi:hypothetical protein
MMGDDYGVCDSCGEQLGEGDMIFNESGELQCGLCGQLIDAPEDDDDSEPLNPHLWGGDAYFRN